MGQAPSAAEGRREDGGDEGDLPCGGRTGCLPAPRFLRRKRDDVVVFENYSVTTDEGPEDLALTDVEDEGEDNDEVSEDSGGASLSDFPREEGWLPECVADLVAAGDRPLLSDLDPDPNLVPRDFEEEEEERSNGGNKTAVIPKDVLAKIVAVDCGMVVNGDRRDEVRTQALRRVSVVDGHGEPLLSALVRVDPPPTGYLSGILPTERRVNSFGDDLDVGVPASEVKEEVSKLFRGKIVVGHSVGGDLAVLGLGRRSTSATGGKGRGFDVRDTASYAPFMRKNGDFATLRELVKERLNRDIQLSGQFHCCEEDAVAALDLYKSVWHEWESMSLEREQTRKAHANHHSNISCEERRERKKQKRKRRRKEVKKLRKLRQHSDRGSRLVVYDLRCLSSARRILVLLLSTLFDIPALFFSGVFRGISRPVSGLVASGRKRWIDKKKKTRKKKKKTHYLQLWFKRHRPHCDSFFLLCHCLLEAWRIVLSCVRCASPAGWDAVLLQSANGALIAGLVGMKLFRMGKHRDQSYFGMLAQYRVLGTLVRMAGCRRSDEVLTVPEAQDHAHFAERMLSALAGQIMHATPMTIAFPIQRQIMIKTAGRVLKTESMMNHFLPIVLTSGPFLKGATPQEHLSLACNAVLSCWFILRYAKKL